MNQKTVIVVGAGGRAKSYAARTKTHPNEIKIIGIAEPNVERRKRFIEDFMPNDCRYIFDSYEQLLEQEKLCDALILSTQDAMHYEPAIKALELGYDLLLEKPMAQTPSECYDIAKKADELGRTVVVCHVMRYTPLFTKLKALLDENIIGELVSIQHCEDVGFFHFAHSFVRGFYADDKISNPFIVAKCCHDMDILSWLIGKKCQKLSSFGSLKLFKKENAPTGATKRCTDGCPVESECPYSALGYLIKREGETEKRLHEIISRATHPRKN